MISMVNLSPQLIYLKKEKNHQKKTHKSISNFLMKIVLKTLAIIMKDTKEMQKPTKRSNLIHLIVKIKNLNFWLIYKEFYGLKTSSIKGENKKFLKKRRRQVNQSKQTKKIINKNNKRKNKKYNTKSKIHSMIRLKVNKQK